MFRLSLCTALMVTACAQLAVAGDAVPIDIKPVNAGTPPAATGPTAGWTLSQKASYLVGTGWGEKLKPFAEDIDAAKIVQGLQDALAGKDSVVAQAEGQQIMQEFQQLIQNRAAKMGEERKATNAKWLADNGKKPGVMTTASGLQYEVVTGGKGKQPSSKDTVSVHYKGVLIDGKQFDSSYDRGKPAEFQVGGVIKGWTEALLLMHEGDKWKLYIPAELAYGENAPPAIGNNQILIFDIELLKVLPAGAPPAP
jgi:FKBP-type peptidyl-prolyl cis-trans isomerase FkpA